MTRQFLVTVSRPAGEGWRVMIQDFLIGPGKTIAEETCLSRHAAAVAAETLLYRAITGIGS